MKALKFLFTASMFLALSATLVGQDESERPQFVVFTTEHWDYDYDDGSQDEWMALATEHFDKVIKKNEHIAGAATLVHYYTADNSELIHVRTYMTWNDIEKAQERNGELVEEAWPDEGERNAFFDKMSAYTTGQHSDEIYRTLGGAKLPEERSEDQMVIYMQKSHGDWPEDGSMDEIQSLDKQYKEVAIHGNEHIKAYYPMRHAWGSDNREFIDVFVVSSLADVGAANMAMNELVEEKWPDEEERNAFFDRYDKYATGWHGDFIYRNIPELSK
jgi:hypothetical protein